MNVAKNTASPQERVHKILIEEDLKAQADPKLRLNKSQVLVEQTCRDTAQQESEAERLRLQLDHVTERYLLGPVMFKDEKPAWMPKTLLQEPTQGRTSKTSKLEKAQL